MQICEWEAPGNVDEDRLVEPHGPSTRRVAKGQHAPCMLTEPYVPWSKHSLFGIAIHPTASLSWANSCENGMIYMSKKDEVTRQVGTGT